MADIHGIIHGRAETCRGAPLSASKRPMSDQRMAGEEGFEPSIS
jgi:hypothetical protein